MLHYIGEVWVPETARLGQKTVWVTQLSKFTDLVGKSLNKIGGKLCLTTVLITFIECVGDHLDSKATSWLESKLPHNCAIELIEGGDPLGVAKQATRGDCTGQVGEPGYPVPTTPPPTGPGSTNPAPTNPAPTNPRPSPGPTSRASVTLTQGPAAPAGYRYAVALSGFGANQAVSLTCYDSTDPGGFYSFNLTTDGSGSASTAGYCYSGNGPDHWVVAGGVTSNHVSWSSSGGGGAAAPPVTTPPATALISASKGGAYGCANCYALDIQVYNFPTGTYTYYCHDNSGAGGADTVFYSHAVTVTAANQGTWPGVFCDDNTPYTAYLVMAGVTSNSVSFAVAPPNPPPSPAPTWTETVGGVTHTWTNYSNAGGAQGASIQTSQSVQITCKVAGFQVADGDTWWYLVASSPWNNAYYASADAFYNNGATSGSLLGTPFVDNAVPSC